MESKPHNRWWHRRDVRRLLMLFVSMYGVAIALSTFAVVAFLRGVAWPSYENGVRNVYSTDCSPWAVYDYSSSAQSEYVLPAYHPPGLREIWCLQEMDDTTSNALHLTTGTPSYSGRPMPPAQSGFPAWAVISNDVSLDRIELLFQHPASLYGGGPENTGTCFWHERTLRFPFVAVHYAGFTVRAPSNEAGVVIRAIFGGVSQSAPKWTTGVYQVRVDRGWFMLNALIIAIVLSITALLAWRFVRYARCLAVVVLRRLLAGGDPEAVPCQQCGYDLRGSPARCPECGLARDSTAN